MRILSVFADQWLGLCRKPPVHVLEAGTCIPPESVYAGLPDGGSGGPETIRRGVGSALSGMRTLNRNRQLLWFTLLAGLVLAGNAIGQGALWCINRTLQPDIIVSYAQDFFLGFATVLCLVLLLAGLILSLSSGNEGHASFFEGLTGAKKYKKALVVWSVILALAGILLYRIWIYCFISLPPELRFLDFFGPFQFVVSTITQFPFNWTLDWAMLTEVPGYGGRSLLLWIYPFGFMETMNFLAISLFLFVLTPFVVPLLVLEHRTLREAVAGSFALMRNAWAETVSCLVLLGGVVCGTFLSYQLLQAVSGIVDPYTTVMFHPTPAWIALAVLYNLILVTVAFLAATVGGIASLDLYRYAGTKGEA